MNKTLTIRECADEVIEIMRSLDYKNSTISTYRKQFNQFINYCDSAGKNVFDQMTAIEYAGIITGRELTDLAMPDSYDIKYVVLLRSLRLRVKDVNLEKKTFTILNAKNHKERIIPIHENTIKRLQEYMIAEEIYRDDQYIFSNRYGNHIDKKTVDYFFLRFLHLAGIPHPDDGPRVHDFRHTFCVHRLRDWVLEGKDINALFPYLCAYMGHADTRCTEYYLRLTADLFPDIVRKSEHYFNGASADE